MKGFAWLPLCLLSVRPLPLVLGNLESRAFDPRAATVESIHHALFNRHISCREVVSSFLSRITAFNPAINAIITLNPMALSVADEMDRRIASGNATGLLFCIPTLLKDNFDAVDMANTGGCLALADNRPVRDAVSVKALKDAGAVILGKTNLHEMALEGLTVSSLGGQTVNPYDHTRTPGGSSGGTGAAVAARFAVLGTGTDTMNSLRSPASANSLFSFRPTRGLISRAGVIPVSHTQDAVGAMANNLDDLALGLRVMAGIGYDSSDNATALIPQHVVGNDYTSSSLGDVPGGLGIGLINGFLNPAGSNETTPVNVAMDHLVSTLRGNGIQIVNITDPMFDPVALRARLDVQKYEYRELLDAYLAETPRTGHVPTSFEDLYSSGKFVVTPNQHGFIREALVSSTNNASYAEAQTGIEKLRGDLQSMFAFHNITAAIYPQQSRLVRKVGSLSQTERNGILAALAGFPVVVVPAGFSDPSEDAPVGIPIGVEILGLPWTEDLLLDTARLVSDLVPARRMPAFANKKLEPDYFETVPFIEPDNSNIDLHYRVGVLSTEGLKG